MNIDKIYQDFENQYRVLFGSLEYLSDFFENYILNAVDDTDLLEVLRENGMTNKGLTPKDYLSNEAVSLRTIRITLLMELSKSFESFKRLHNKVKRDKSQPISLDFDKALDTLLKA